MINEYNAGYVAICELIDALNYNRYFKIFIDGDNIETTKTIIIYSSVYGSVEPIFRFNRSESEPDLFIFKATLEKNRMSTTYSLPIKNSIDLHHALKSLIDTLKTYNLHRLCTMELEHLI